MNRYLYLQNNSSGNSAVRAEKGVKESFRKKTWIFATLCLLVFTTQSGANNIPSIDPSQNQGTIAPIYTSESNGISINPDPLPPGLFCNSLHKYEKLAVNGDISAQTVLGMLYREGQCVEQNYSKAIEWYNLALNYFTRIQCGI